VYPVGNLFIPAPHGQLEAILKEAHNHYRATNDEAAVISEQNQVALVLHPHPLHGGTMHNKVVFRAARALNDAGLTTLRINFRGVGQSTGTHDEGRGEQDDARIALDYLMNNYAEADVTLAGFSFGARVGMEVGMRDNRVRRLISIGTPVNMTNFSFLSECRKPILFVHGERDEFGDLDRLRSLVSTLPAEAEARLEIISGVGHFFDGKLDEMSRTITDWTKQRIEQT
jgi:uncharacterized protein